MIRLENIFLYISSRKEPLFGLSSGLSHNTFTRKSISAINFHLCIRHTQIGTGTVPVKTPLYFCRHTGNFRIKLKQRYFLISYKTPAAAFPLWLCLTLYSPTLITTECLCLSAFPRNYFCTYNYSKMKKRRYFFVQ